MFTILPICFWICLAELQCCCYCAVAGGWNNHCCYTSYVACGFTSHDSRVISHTEDTHCMYKLLEKERFYSNSIHSVGSESIIIAN